MNKKKIIFFLFTFFITFEEECDNWDSKYRCKNNDDFSIPDSWDERGFQTPPRNDIYGRYKKTYQDMHYLVGYAQLNYSMDKNQCIVKFITKVNPKLGEEGKDYYLLYNFGNITQKNNTIILNSKDDKYPDGMPISAKIIDNKTNVELVKLELEEEYFMWDNPKIEQSSRYENGQKGGIVEFFGWPYEDIALECEFLSHAGYMGLKVYSPNEHLFVYTNVEDGILNPWWYIYQPVSYKLHSRMGDRKQLKSMINICRGYNLRIYADVVINHMTGSGNDMYDTHRNKNGNNCDHWGEKGSSGGSPFWNIGYRYENNSYTGLEPGLEFPSVPYFPSDFHCVNDITNWNDAYELNGGWLTGLADLNTEKEYVHQRIVDFFIELLSIGFSGISLPNSKHIFPSTYASLFKSLKNSLGGKFPEDFIAVLQLTYGWEKNILMCEKTKLSCFGEYFLDKLKTNNLTDEDINKIKIWNSGFPQESPECDGNWKISPERHALSIENPDDINLNSYYNIYIRDKNIDIHKERTKNMFSNTQNNWKIKSVFSMFSLISDSNGFPDGKSDCSKCKSENCKKYCYKSFPYKKAYNPLSIGYDTGNSDNWKEGEYTRVHRDLEIINSMREWMNLTKMTEYELYYGERLRANCSEKCLICNDESKRKNMCLICNKSNGFYPLIYPGYKQKYFECLNYSLKFERIYFNKTEEAFKPCYESCRECEMEGNSESHNCLKCDVDLIERPGTSGTLKNCVVNCSYTYNITLSGQYKCVEIVKCTEEAKNYIREKNICIDDCKKDNKYKYSYRNICLEICPDNTFEKDFLCLENNNENEENTNLPINNGSFIPKINSDECTLSLKEIEINSFRENGVIGSVIENYTNQFYYTNKHILQLKNNNYNVAIYRECNCIDELSLKIPKIDFGECYYKAQQYSKTKEKLIVVYVEKTQVKYPNFTYSLYNPNTSKKIDGQKICDNDTIILENNINEYYSNNKISNFEIIRLLTEQGIDIFNSSDPFFYDICYHYNSPFKKDITLKDRILSFYPDITLCGSGCEYKGVNITTMSCKCLCRFNDIVNNDLVKDSILITENINDAVEMVSNSNIEVLLCFKYAFSHIKKSIGGYIIIVSIIICTCFTLVFALRDFKKINDYIFNLTENYLNYISEKPTVEDISKNDIIFERNNKMSLNAKNDLVKHRKRSIKNKPVEKKETINQDNNANRVFNPGKNSLPPINKSLLNSKDILINKKEFLDVNRKKVEIDKITHKNKDFFIEYLATSVDDLDFDDAIIKDHRSFCEYLCDSIKDNQLIVNTFYSKDPLRPFSIKVILFTINIDLYFLVNGLFYSEDYISEIFHSENEQFFSFFERSISRFVYVSLVSFFINFLIDFFFIQEKKIKGIFLREKHNLSHLKFEISSLVKRIKKRYFSFIITIFIFLILFWYYLLCFNYVYPYTQIDWIKSSIVIIVIIQIITLITSFLESLLRFLSFFLRSEKIFKVSKLLE